MPSKEQTLTSQQQEQLSHTLEIQGLRQEMMALRQNFSEVSQILT
jgi:hypothetical protein